MTILLLSKLWNFKGFKDCSSRQISRAKKLGNGEVRVYSLLTLLDFIMKTLNWLLIIFFMFTFVFTIPLASKEDLCRWIYDSLAYYTFWHDNSVLFGPFFGIAALISWVVHGLFKTRPLRKIISLSLLVLYQISVIFFSCAAGGHYSQGSAIIPVVGGVVVVFSAMTSIYMARVSYRFVIFQGWTFCL